MKRLLYAAAALLAVPAGALGQQAEEPICTDRPTKANATCTVPVGKWQLENSPAGWSRTETNGTESKVLTLGSSVLKYGLSERADLQVGFTPLVRSESRVGGVKSDASGFGDLTIRYKNRLTRDGASVQVGVIPFVKLPTADGDIGNGKVEGGIALPISIATGGPVTVVLGPELDLSVNGDGSGHHPALVNLVNVSGPILKRATLYAELWTMTKFDPSDTITLASANTAIAYLVSPKWQLDLGANLGLTKDTPDKELYLGLSLRF